MKRWNILVADDISPQGLEILSACGEVSNHQGLSPEQLKAELPGRHALIVRSATKVTAEALEAADELLVIGRAGIGVDNVDLDAATAKGIVVMNTPDPPAPTTTGELAISLLLSMASRARSPMADRLTLKAGRWEKKQPHGRGADRQGVRRSIGLGRIGRVVAERAVKGCRDARWSRSTRSSISRLACTDHVRTNVSTSSELCRRSATSCPIHVPLSPETTISCSTRRRFATDETRGATGPLPRAAASSTRRP